MDKLLQKLATVLHDKLCYEGHEYDCCWHWEQEYGKRGWDRPTREYWLRMAKSFVRDNRELLKEIVNSTRII